MLCPLLLCMHACMEHKKHINHISTASSLFNDLSINFRISLLEQDGSLSHRGNTKQQQQRQRQWLTVQTTYRWRRRQFLKSTQFYLVMEFAVRIDMKLISCCEEAHQFESCQLQPINLQVQHADIPAALTPQSY